MFFTCKCMRIQQRDVLLAAPAHLVSILRLVHSHNITHLNRMAEICRDKNSQMFRQAEQENKIISHVTGIHSSQLTSRLAATQCSQGIQIHNEKTHKKINKNWKKWLKVFFENKITRESVFSRFLGLFRVIVWNSLPASSLLIVWLSLAACIAPISRCNRQLFKPKWKPNSDPQFASRRAPDAEKKLWKL